MPANLKSGQTDFVPEQFVMKSQTAQVLQRSRREKKRGPIRHLHGITRSIPLGEFPPRLRGLDESHVMLATTLTLGIYFVRDLDADPLAPRA